MDSRWQRVNELFQQALEMPAGQRDAFLQEHCPDAEVRSEVVSLLAEDARADDEAFLNTGPLEKVGQPASRNPGDPMAGRWLGAYRIEREIGAGGIGTVYLGVRNEPYRQLVAIKVIKRGMDTDAILRRFRTEIRVQAALSRHSNIAGLLDAGTTEDGRSYFVMEYVEGERIDRYCQNRQLTVEERLRLFIGVCEAVEYAHRHAVIHRDLKPSNVLVTADGTPKLIDFGIAKLTNPEFDAETVALTLTEMRVLTPEYASPEQIRGESLTTASDVYSLGVLLYELLTGCRPYRFGTRSLAEFQRQLRDRDPERPSTAALRNLRSNGSEPTEGQARQEDSDDVGPGEPAARRQRAKKLRARLRGDLDNIVLLALRANPRHRYSSVERMADDLRRHLAGETVSARSISLLEQGWRWSRRNPAAVALILALAFGLTVGSWMLSQLTRSMVRSTALEGAAQQARAFERIHEFYSQEVQRVEKLPDGGEQAAEKMTSPARFVMDLADYITEKEREQAGKSVPMYARLYSRYPFRDPETGESPPVVMDEFERTALKRVESGEVNSSHRFVEYEGAPAVRYVESRVMLKSCVDCHNEHPDSPKQDWEVGEVGGAVEIIRPLETDLVRVRRGLRGTFLKVGAASLAFVGLGLLLGVVCRRRSHTG